MTATSNGNGKDEHTLPRTVEEITIDWLNSIFSPHKIHVEEFACEGDAKNGKGMLSDLIRLKLQIRKNNNSTIEELKVVLKSLPSDPNIRAYTSGRGYNSNEVQMYTKVLPALNAFLDSRGVSESNRFGTPICYFGAEEGTDGSPDYNFVLVLEDLLASDFKMWEGANRSFDWCHASAAIRGIALFHASALAFKVANGVHLYEDEFPKFIKHKTDDPALDNYIKSGFQATREVIKAGKEPVPDGLMVKLDQLEENFKPYVKKMAIDVDESAVNVIRHTDLHFFNVAFSYNEDGQCSQAKWFDFQNASEGRPMHDLGFLLLLDCEPQFSSENLDKSLRFYHDTFMSLLKEAKIHIDYPLDTMKQEFSRYRLPSILHIISGAPFWCCGPNSSDESRDRLRRAITYAYKIGELEFQE